MRNPVSRRPLVGLALSYIIGTLLGFRFPGPIEILLGLSAVAGAALAGLCLRPAPTPALSDPKTGPNRDAPAALMAGGFPGLLTHAAVLLTGWTVAALFLVNRFPEPADMPSTGAGAPIEVIGVVSADAVFQAFSGNAAWWSFPLAVQAVRSGPAASWQRRQGQIRVQWNQGIERASAPTYGERWRMRGVLTVPRGTEFTSTPARRPRCRLRVAPDGAQYLSAGHGNRFLAACYAANAAAVDHVTRGIRHHTDAVAVLQALLGYQQRLPWEMRRDFASTGTIHIFAISGLHVAMLTAMLVFVLTACRIPRTHWILFLAPLLIAYTAATGMSSSAVRACIMAIAFFAAPLLGREGDALSALSLAAISILIVRPDQLFDPGFLLSFSAVLGLICLYPPFQSYATRRVGPDPLRVQPEPRYATLMRHAFLYVWALAVASAAASLVTTPIVAYFFGIVPLIGLVGNLVAVPLAFLIVCTACLSLFLGSLIPALGEVFNHANWLLVSMLTRTINLLADVPGSHFAVRLPSGWLVLPWYVGLAALVAKLSVDTTRRSAYSSVSAETRPGAETDPSSPG